MESIFADNRNFIQSYIELELISICLFRSNDLPRAFSFRKIRKHQQLAVTMQIINLIKLWAIPLEGRDICLRCHRYPSIVLIWMEIFTHYLWFLKISIQICTNVIETVVIQIYIFCRLLTFFYLTKTTNKIYITNRKCLMPQ